MIQPPTSLPFRPQSLILLLLLVLCLPGWSRAEDSSPTWLLTTKLSGDFRYRHEGFDAEGSAARFRNRIRYRLALTNAVNEKLKVGVRFASGMGDHRSTNIDLDGSSGAKTINLDRAYFELSPGDCWWVTAGKIANPFQTTSLTWDSDINLEGGATRVFFDSAHDLSVTGGGFWLDQMRGGRGSGLLAGQLSATGATGALNWLGAAGFESFVNPDLVRGELGSNGNTVVRPDSVTLRYRTDYEVAHLLARLTLPVAHKSKLTLTVNPVLNTATSSDNIGWLVQAKLSGRVCSRSSSLSYDYRLLEPDAFLGYFVDSDAAGGRTDQRSHHVTGELDLLDGFSLGGTAIFSTLTASGDGPWYQRWMLDGLVKF